MNCISINNQECKVIPEIIDVSSNNPIFYPFSVKINSCSGNCNSINDSYARIARSIKWHETCKRICRLNKIMI